MFCDTRTRNDYEESGRQKRRRDMENIQHQGYICNTTAQLNLNLSGSAIRIKSMLSAKR